jgi:hypothetical protein
MAIKVAVRHVIDTAAGAAHQDGAQGEHRQQMPAWKTAGGNPQG